jgi:hypothetical protein
MMPRLSLRPLALAAALVVGPSASAQAPAVALPVPDNAQPLLRREHWLAGLMPPSGYVPGSNTARVFMPGMMPGFISSSPIGMIPDEDVYPPDDPGTAVVARSPLEGSEPDWVRVDIGRDNPLFDLRRPGDPGGVGYYRLFSQMQVADWGSTSVCLGLQAVTPAGQKDGGLQNGPTVLTPGLSIFQDLGNGTALQGYVGHELRPRMNDFDENTLKWGVGFQCPVPLLNSRTDQGLFFYMQALAHYNYEGYRPDGRATTWEFVPGVHYRFNSNCWMSLGASKHSLLTCVFQF